MTLGRNEDKTQHFLITLTLRTESDNSIPIQGLAKNTQQIKATGIGRLRSNNETTHSLESSTA